MVTFKGHQAGTLSEIGGGAIPDTRFLYHDDWKEPIACALPIETRDHYWRGGLIPFFEHLAPEGWLRGRQAKAGGTAEQDDFGLLLQYGEDCVGAVGIRPAEKLADHAQPSSDIVEEAAVVPGKTLSGVQKKLLAWRDDRGFRPCLGHADPASHIAKFNRPDLETLVQNEDLSLRLAREILGEDRVTVASPATLRGIEGIALLVERFDRQEGNLLRLEDFAQILKRPRGRQFDGKYDSSYEEAATAIENYSARARIDLARYFDLVVFNLVIGNADAHLKNFSLLERPEGLRLSPAYDLVNTLVYSGYERDAALEIGGQKREFEALDRVLVEKLGTDIGLTAKTAQQTLDRLAASFANARVLAFPSQVQPDDFRIRYRDIVHANAARILA
nr:HipA domain-containing protein [Sphingomonas crusticola]